MLLREYIHGFSPRKRRRVQRAAAASCSRFGYFAEMKKKEKRSDVPLNLRDFHLPGDVLQQRPERDFPNT